MTLLSMVSAISEGVSLSVANAWTAIQTFLQVSITGGINIKAFNYKFFEDNMNGDQVDPRWTFTQVAGSPTFTKQSGVGYGYLFDSVSSTGKGEITFGDSNNYDARSCTFYTTYRIDEGHANNSIRVGVSDTDGDAFASTSKYLNFELSTSNSHYQLQTSDGTTTSRSSTGVSAVNATWTTWKMIVNDTNARMYQLSSGSWDLKVTKTTNLPADPTAVQPALSHVGSTTTGTGSVRNYRIEDDG